MNKEIFYSELPVELNKFILRKRELSDLAIQSSWPSYPDPYSAFNFSYKTAEQQIERFSFYENTESLVALSIDYHEKLVGSITFSRIDWKSKQVGNIGFRLHPNWCDKGVGTELLNGILSFSFSFGFLEVNLDVSKENKRAISVYKRNGFKIIGEIQNGENFHWVMRRTV